MFNFKNYIIYIGFVIINSLLLNMFFIFNFEKEFSVWLSNISANVGTLFSEHLA